MGFLIISFFLWLRVAFHYLEQTELLWSSIIYGCKCSLIWFPFNSYLSLQSSAIATMLFCAPINGLLPVSSASNLALDDKLYFRFSLTLSSKHFDTVTKNLVNCNAFKTKICSTGLTSLQCFSAKISYGISTSNNNNYSLHDCKKI